MPKPTAEIATVRQILGSGARYVVPDYQRFYSWTEEEAGQLLNDLLDAFDGSDTTDAEPYFLGTILLAEAANAGQRDGSPTEDPQSLDVVDGAQRLTTLTILLAILRDAITGETAEARAGLNRLITIDDQHQSPILTLRDPDQPFFAQTVQRPGATAVPHENPQQFGSHQRLLGVRDFLRTELASGETDRLQALARFILDTCIVTRVVTYGLDSAMQLFMVLNGRGKPLSTTDILRSLLIDRVPPDVRSACLDQWSEAEALLAGDMEELFAHIRSQHDRQRPKIINATLQVADDVGGAAAYISSVLAPQARALSIVRGNIPPDWPEAASLARAFKSLGWLKGDADWLPPTLFWIARHLTAPQAISSSIGEIERLAYVLRLLNMGARKRQQRFAAVTRAMRRGDTIDPDHPAFGISREEARIARANLSQLHRRNAPMTKFVLLRLNETLSASGSWIAEDDLSVEHILPQRTFPGSHWREVFPDPEQRDRYAHSLGNLTLIPASMNVRAGSLDFSDKKKIYFAAPATGANLLLEELAHETDWGPAQIEAREKRLLELAQGIWRL